MSKTLSAVAIVVGVALSSLFAIGCIDGEGDSGAPPACEGKCDGDGPSGSGYLGTVASFDASPVDRPLQLGVVGLSMMVVLPIGMLQRRKPV